MRQEKELVKKTLGETIREYRMERNMTQEFVAESLGVSRQAVSKWENGRAMPDSSLMLDLCKELKITVNDLLSGEVVSVNNYNENSEKIILEMVKEKEQSRYISPLIINTQTLDRNVLNQHWNKEQNNEYSHSFSLIMLFSFF